MNKRILGFLLCLMLFWSIAMPAFATEEESSAVLKIESLEDFLEFAENCRLDSFSQNLTVSLEQDIDLTHVKFESIPIFGGTFDGNGHSITGLSITSSGSVQGLFRYIRVGALVQNLNIQAQIHPQGSRSQIGGIVGHNAGHILNCTFTGSIAGSDYVGGIAGKNAVTGLIENCQAEGTIHGDHFVGGVAGDNYGVIRNCQNHAMINTTPQQNTIEISDITMDTLTNSEAVNTVTDIGGIAGISSGVIRECVNHADVGYPHMGYNVGGIAGTQCGYIVDSVNHGNIQARKEVGGIAGQAEPVSYIEYTEDTLQILQDQLGTVSGLINRAAGNAQTSTESIQAEIVQMEVQAEMAKDAVETLFSDPEGVPDMDSILAAGSTLASTLEGLSASMDYITDTANATMSGLNRDLRAVSSQINAMEQTIQDASEHLGVAITDISDLDTDEILSGKISGCMNDGNILADLNAGGIAGAMAMENDLDILEDWVQVGEESLNSEYQVRAVVINCYNLGTVTGKKQNAGGIVGWQSMGLVKECTNTGTVDGSGAEYIGGISGLSTGYIRSSYAKCQLLGKAYTGGIAGSATLVTDSISQVRMGQSMEYMGAILGNAQQAYREEAAPIANNIYLCVDRDYGGIDGISYAGLAEAKDLTAFLAAVNLPELFRNVTVTFRFPSGESQVISVPLGGTLHVTQIPLVPQKPGHSGAWEGLESAVLTDMHFDLTFDAVYTPHQTVIQSAQTRENALPLLLMEGTFASHAYVSAAPSELAPSLSQEEILLESWSIQTNALGNSIRFQIPENARGENLQLYICDGEHNWRQAESHLDGSYLVFALQESDTHFCITQTVPMDSSIWILLAVVVLLLVVPLGKHWHSKKTKPAQSSV